MAFDSKNWMNTLFGVSVTLIPHPSCVDPNEAPDKRIKKKKFKYLSTCVVIEWTLIEKEFCPLFMNIYVPSF